MKKLLIFLMLSFVITLQAQIKGTNIIVRVSPDHADWTYKTGETARLTATVLKSGCPLTGVRIDYEAGPVMYPDVKKTDVTLSNGQLAWKATMKQPGFYQLKVTAHVDDKDYEGLCTVGFSPERIQPTTTCPDDFDSFWQGALREARYTSLEPTRRLLPERCTEKVNVYEVSFQNNSWGSRIYGVLCIPTKPGRYPALLRVPGAGVRPYTGDIWTAEQGAITLEIGVHGIPVTLPQGVYDDLAKGALNGYWEANLDNRDKMPYKRIFTGAIRAIDYIATLPEWNGEQLGVAGSSQGGMLSLVCAALDKRVTFIGVVHDALCDHTASLHGVACGWPHYFYGEKNPDPKKVKVSAYYDGVNFARRVTCKGWYSFGFNDVVVPPTSSYGTYNVITAPKQLSVYPETGHFWYQEQWDEWENWILQQMKLRP
ncbi:MAG: acetylxylan esterase [Prevotella sp.]|nr:acetylxylan esterase [Prevotella sp.]